MEAKSWPLQRPFPKGLRPAVITAGLLPVISSIVGRFQRPSCPALALIFLSQISLLPDYVCTGRTATVWSASGRKIFPLSVNTFEDKRRITQRERLLPDWKPLRARG